jgi:hypothetical protein
MSENEKTWVIGITDDLVTKKPIAESPTTTRPAVRPTVRATASRPAVRVQPKAPVPAPARRRLHFALELALTYLLGPFALLLTDRGRQGRGWVAAGIASGLAGIGMVVWRDRILLAVDVGWAIVLLMITTALVALLWFSAWSRALMMTGEPDMTRRRLRREQIPSWLKKPWSLGAVSFLVPGLGLLLTGRLRRAAIVLWLGQLGIVAGLTLYHSPWAWQVNKNSALGAIDSNLLEGSFLLAGAILIASIAGWIVQALEGSRQALLTRSGSTRARGDWYALALVGSLAAMALVNDPAPIAQNLDEQAGRLHQSGCKVIPLALTLAAHHCDPAQSRYPIQAMGLYEELGRPDRAAAMRVRLDRNLGPFVNLVMGESPALPASQEVFFAQNTLEPEQVPVLQDAVLAVAESADPDPAVLDPAISDPVVSAPDSDKIAPAAFFGTMVIPDPQ